MSVNFILCFMTVWSAWIIVWYHFQKYFSHEGAAIFVLKDVKFWHRNFSLCGCQFICHIVCNIMIWRRNFCNNYFHFTEDTKSSWTNLGNKTIPFTVIINSFKDDIYAVFCTFSLTNEFIDLRSSDLPNLHSYETSASL